MARQTGASFPCGLQAFRRLNRLPGLLGDDADEVLPDDDLQQARHVPHRALIHADERGTHARRPHHPAVHHAWHPYVVDELELSRGHCRQIDTPDRLPEHGPLARMLSLRAGAEQEVERSSADELAEADALRCIRLRADHAAGSRELIHRHGEPLRGKTQERLAGGGSGLGEIVLVEVGGDATGCPRWCPGRAWLPCRTG